MSTRFLRVCAALVGVAALASCGLRAEKQAAFEGPDPTVLSVTNLDTCPGEVSSARKGSLTVGTAGSAGFSPETEVDLRWSIPTRDMQGTWESVVTSEEGDLATTVKLPSEVLVLGDVLEVWAQGSGRDGITAARAEVTIGC